MSFVIIIPTGSILAQLGLLKDRKGIRRLLHLAIVNALRVAVFRSNTFARAIVPEKTGLLMESGIRFAEASLVAATAGVNLKSLYQLELAWPVSYARYVTLLPQSTTKWTKGGSRSDYQLQIFDFVLRNFWIQLAIEIAKLRNLRI